MKTLLKHMCAVPFVAFAMTAVAQDTQQVEEILNKSYVGVTHIINAEYEKGEMPTINAIRLPDALEFDYKDATKWAEQQAACGSEFQYLHSKGTQMSMAVNTEAMQKLLQATDRSPELDRNVQQLLMESASSLGESYITMIWHGLRDYWGCPTERSRRFTHKASGSHLKDPEGRLNPVALYGEYHAYWVYCKTARRKIGFHEWLNNKASANPLYADFAKEAQAHYPEPFCYTYEEPVAPGAEESEEPIEKAGFVLMLRFENQWIQLWQMAQDAELEKEEDPEDYEEIVEMLNEYATQSLRNHAELTPAQRQYIRKKYPIDHLLQIPGETSDPSDVQGEAQGQAGSAAGANSPEVAEWNASAQRCIDAHISYYHLLQDNAVWENAQYGMVDSRLKKLIKYIQMEEFRIFAEKTEQLKDIAIKINSKASAEASCAQLAVLLWEMDRCAENIQELTKALRGAHISSTEREKEETLKLCVQICINMMAAECNIVHRKNFVIKSTDDIYSDSFWRRYGKNKDFLSTHDYYWNCEKLDKLWHDPKVGKEATELVALILFGAMLDGNTMNRLNSIRATMTQER